MPWKKGQSGNPAGVDAKQARMRRMLEDLTPRAINRLGSFLTATTRPWRWLPSKRCWTAPGAVPGNRRMSRCALRGMWRIIRCCWNWRTRRELCKRNAKASHSMVQTPIQWRPDSGTGRIWTRRAFGGLIPLSISRCRQPPTDWLQMWNDSIRRCHPLQRLHLLCLFPLAIVGTPP